MSNWNRLQIERQKKTNIKWHRLALMINKHDSVFHLGID